MAERPSCCSTVPDQSFRRTGSDSRFITYGSQWPDYRYLHSWTVQLSGSPQQKPRPFLQHDYTDADGHFSPGDTKTSPRWIAYTSDETGRFEVYVRDFPSGDRKWQISDQGGLLPL